jgi:hypothetical protein
VNGAVFFRGPSLLTGAPIMAIVTGLDLATSNEKTGDLLQVWILRADIAPQEAKRRNLDDAVCGDCKLRGESGHGSVCYVPAWMGPNNVFKAAALERDTYIECSAEDAAVLVEGRQIRLGAYGDPAAIPIEVWWKLLKLADGWIGYTHQWHHLEDAWQWLLMASVDTEEERLDAKKAGWRTFRMKDPRAPLMMGEYESRGRMEDSGAGFRIKGHYFAPTEFACPASEEMQRRTTCAKCMLCAGLSSAAKDVAINVHGHDGALVNFYKGRHAVSREVERRALGWPATP